jgi:hypothetical protein
MSKARLRVRIWLHDWHRVEHAIMSFMLETIQLRSAGWTEVPSRPTS